MRKTWTGGGGGGLGVAVAHSLTPIPGLPCWLLVIIPSSHSSSTLPPLRRQLTITRHDHHIGLIIRGISKWHVE